MFDLSNYLPYLMNRTMARLAAMGDAEFARFGIKLQGWRVLAALYAEDGQRISELANSTSIEISTVSRLVDALEAQGLVEKRRERPRARSVTAQLTRQGRTLVQRLVPSAEYTEEAAVKGISAADLAVVKRALKKMFDNLGRFESEAKTGRKAG
jgi:DNA-binding MarR family transcriptional regulator